MGTYRKIFQIEGDLMCELIDIREYDAMVGRTGVYVLCGQTALCRRGLTTAITNLLQVWTLYPNISRVNTGITQFFFNPVINYTDDLNKSPKHPNILEPTQERALIEAIWLREYFDEGILIESLKSYDFQHNGDFSKLYEIAHKYHCTREMLNYWIEEARNDFDD